MDVKLYVTVIFKMHERCIQGILNGISKVYESEFYRYIQWYTKCFWNGILKVKTAYSSYIEDVKFVKFKLKSVFDDLK